MKGKPKASRVLVLGVSGMLGSMVFRRLKERGFDVVGTARDPKALPGGGEGVVAFDAEAPLLDEELFSRISPDFVVNAIGIIKPYCKDDDPAGVARAIRVNALFPHLLRDAGARLSFRTIQIATDCVYSGQRGHYLETDPHDALDVYGKSKSLGEADHPFFLNIRTSIIGPEEKGKLSLLEWFLAQPARAPLKGFTHHRWNGVTTLQFADMAAEIIGGGAARFDELRALGKTHHYLPNSSVDKHELLSIFCAAFGREHEIVRVGDVGPPVDRTLSTSLSMLPREVRSMKDAVEELAEYMRDHTISPYA